MVLIYYSQQILSSLLAHSLPKEGSHLSLVQQVIQSCPWRSASHLGAVSIMAMPVIGSCSKQLEPNISRSNRGCPDHRALFHSVCHHAAVYD
jgi:hypothetical protein